MFGQAILTSFLNSAQGGQTQIADTNILPPATEKPDYTPLYFIGGLAAIIAFLTLKK